MFGTAWTAGLVAALGVAPSPAFAATYNKLTVEGGGAGNCLQTNSLLTDANLATTGCTNNRSQWDIDYVDGDLLEEAEEAGDGIFNDDETQYVFIRNNTAKKRGNSNIYVRQCLKRASDNSVYVGNCTNTLDSVWAVAGDIDRGYALSIRSVSAYEDGDETLLAAGFRGSVVLDDDASVRAWHWGSLR